MDNRISQDVKDALDKQVPVVALESTVISHGLPSPINYNTAIACEQAIHKAGAVPATVGVVNGVPRIGLTEVELQHFASGSAPDGNTIEKVSLNNLAPLMARRGWGATTVAASIRIATMGGRPFSEFRQSPRPLVFTTGGIGGVHYGAPTTFDISADLTALATCQIVCVCAGAKSILDLRKTLEYLETQGVPVIGYQTDELPAFYSARSGLAVTARVDAPRDAADIALAHWKSGGRGAVLVCVPVEAELELSSDELERLTTAAMEEGRRQAISGKALTPFLLSELARASSGRTLAANQSLLVNNASVAGLIAVALDEKAWQSAV
ncbi:MAG TPA: pseudouridine-5'-phosphate glycosidase [Blastocatellia bacterium]